MISFMTWLNNDCSSRIRWFPCGVFRTGVELKVVKFEPCKFEIIRLELLKALSDNGKDISYFEERTGKELI